MRSENDATDGGVQDILSSASRALRGRNVSVWESDDQGRIWRVAASDAPDPIESERKGLTRAMRRWSADRVRRGRWVASHIGPDRWCVAPVRRHPPRAPVVEGDRRSPERTVLELAGACIGMLDHQHTGEQISAPDVDALRSTMQAMEGFFEHVPANAKRDPREHAHPPARGSVDPMTSGGMLAQLHAMVESAHDAIIGKTLDGTITYWNPAATRQYGYSAEEMIGRSVGAIIPPELPNELPRILDSLRRGERVENHETIRLRKNGERIHVSVTVSPIRDAHGRPIGGSAIARDISERIAIEEKLRHGALHDSLTSLPNRAYFNGRVAESLARMRRDHGYRFAVLFLDFDDFKVVNDSMGHSAGDLLLQRIAERLPACVRPGDLIARLGGDEFTVLLEDLATPESVELAVERVHASMAAPFEIGDRQVEVTVSVGAALADASYERPEDLLRDADLAMYHAKRTGHGRLKVFDVAMRDWAHARFSMTTDLRRALERGELKLAFQPIVDLASGKVRSFEALIRWQHPTRGLILPDDFIPLAEQTGLIVPIGAWVLEKACEQARRWQVELPGAADVSVSVNLSGKQIGDARIVGEVRRVLDRTGLNPRTLRLEITETVLLETSGSSAAQLEALRKLDVELHVDDFGTGYSWLSYLPRFPLQAIKVDKSFVRRMGTRRTDVEIVRSIVDLATTLGLGVIAEGVETVGQRDRLLAFGCELGQGFLFSKAVDAESTIALLGRSALGFPLTGKGSPGAAGW